MTVTINRGSKAGAYDLVLADLRAQRERIDQAISAIEEVRGTKSQTDSTPNPFEPGPYTGKSISDAAIAVLRERGEPMGNGEIANAIRAGGLSMKSVDVVNTVGAVLTRRAKDAGDLVKVGRGIWGLPEWEMQNLTPEDLGIARSEKSVLAGQEHQNPLSLGRSYVMGDG